MPMSEVLQSIKILRKAIRYHRDQKGDDRCWLDDEHLWALLPEAKSSPRSLPPFQEMMKRCAAFHRFRRLENPDVVSTNDISNPLDWDRDLQEVEESKLFEKLEHLQNAVRKHRNISNRERTFEDDRELYLVLPEKLPADFRLPPESEFLGEAKAPCAGCPSFWRSHERCGTDKHDLHRWGPC